MEDEDKLVGFWYSEYDRHLPMPVANEQDWEGGPMFRTALTMIQIRMQNSQKEAKPLGEVIRYKGMSHCRLCNCMNGSMTFKLGGFTWPSGYLHYLDEPHFVRPDPTFQQFIKDWARDRITVGGKPLIL